jgi:hypothetical protein
MIDSSLLQRHLVGEGKHMAKKKALEVQDELKTVAVAVGSALGKLAAKMGLSETAALAAQKPPAQKPAPKKKVVAKKVSTKRSGPGRSRIGQKGTSK